MGSTKGKIKYLLSKEFTFSAAHRIINNYSGKCTNLHGHTWTVIIYLEGYELDNRNMLMDFNEIKVINQWIAENLDHSAILWEKDPMLPSFREHSQKVFSTRSNPTSEHLASLILEKAIEYFNNSKVRVESVEVKESCTASARVYAQY